MKRILAVFFVVSLLASCSSPVLKWIDTPDGVGGRLSGQSGDKEIVSFSFGIEGETDLPIGKNPDSTGKIPISVILPMGTGTRLTPTVKFIGKSLNPPSGAAENFSSPVVYTVTADDDSSRAYIIKVFEKGLSTKAIVRFAVDVSGGLTAEGVINDIDADNGAITESVPAGTNLASLNAKVAHTGAAVLDPKSGSHPDETFTYNGDLSLPTTWTVIAQDYSTKIYTVTVIKEKSNDKEIMQFSLGVSGENVIIGGEPQPDGKYPILVVVPSATALSSVAPAYINYTGVSISPTPVIPEDFSNPAIPVTYTVTAEDRSIREYAVKVIENNISAADTRAQITGFYFMDPLVEGVIDEVAHTIALTVPSGTKLNALRPEIYYIGKSVSPMSGAPKDFSTVTGTPPKPVPVKYTVYAQDGTTKQDYLVSVFTAAAPPVVDVPGTSGEKVAVGTNPDGSYTIIIEMPVFIDNPQININFPGGGQISQNITNNNTTVINNDYTVIVVSPPSGAPASDAASIDAFYFTDPVAIGVIGATGAGTPVSPVPIDVEVPYDTDLRNLAPTIAYTGKDIAGIPGASPLNAPARSFYDSTANRVVYTVEAQNGAAKTYAVAVTAALNPAREITDFTFTGVTHPPAIISAQPNVDGEYPIEVTVPASTPLGSLNASITYTGSSITALPAGSPQTAKPFTETGKNFSGADISGTPPINPVKYTVTAADTSTKTYAVTVREEDINDDEKEITGFYFTSPLAAGVIVQDANTITVTVPAGTNLSSLRPTVYFEGMSLKPGSGSAVNFSGPVIYTVTARNGTNKSYTVTVKATPSNAKDITRFSFPGIINTETVIGAVPDADGTYPLSVWVPAGTALGNLAPAITHTGVSISPVPETARNFSTPQDYTVTAEDGTTKTYKVTVSTTSGDAKIITSFIFEGAIRAAGSIDQGAHTIMVAVPYGTSLTGLTPAITYIGRSITPPGGGTAQTANPFTDTNGGSGRNFTSPLTYTVNDSGTGTQAYAVTVTVQSAVNVSFTGENDVVFASSTYDQSTGVVTVTIDPTKGVIAPYEWYVDGVKQAVSTNTTTFTLNVGNGSFIPGRHEIMVSGWKGGLHYSGRAAFVVSR